jgi:hypothetical protein
MVKNKSGSTGEIVKVQYEELMETGLPFLQIFPEMVQEMDIAQTFKRRANERSKSITQSKLDERKHNIEKFREDLFLYCGMNLSILKPPTQTQAAFWSMLFNWLECNNYPV